MRDRSTPVWKRALDLVIAIPAIVLLLPVFALIAVLVWAFHGRPILFRQLRPGKHGVAFELVKFRSMLGPVDADGRPLSEAERLTRFGRLLRSTSLDEIPEFWNVVRGDMSLVGPRPLLMAYLPLYTPEQARRHDVLPGITGLAQVSGRNELDWEERLRLDSWYVSHRSLALDLRILVRTVGQVLLRRGIASRADGTVQRFRGR